MDLKSQELSHWHDKLYGSNGIIDFVKGFTTINNNQLIIIKTN
jgi:hypothetical protein